MGILKIGWAETDITPGEHISLAGQFAERISEYIEKPLTATAMALEADGEQVGEEGCLSLPGLAGEVARPSHVVCKAFDREMNPITVEGTDLLARCICHELDHLDGVLYKDLAIDGLHRVDLPETEEDPDEYKED